MRAVDKDGVQLLHGATRDEHRVTDPGEAVQVAVSAPYENPYNNAGSGAVWQLHGTGSGLTTSGSDVFGPADYGLARGSGLGAALNH
ncbi:hypothetical protein ACWGDT_44895 [Streptomyces avermitilis]